MRKFYLLLVSVVMAAMANAQSSANYTFTTGTSATFTDMTSGTTQIVGAGTDDAAGANTAIGFDFWLMGNRYTQFNATSNGFVGLSSTGTTVASTAYSVAGGTATTPMIASCGGDLKTGPAGKVHYKVIGFAPNRILVIEFLNMTIIYDGTTDDGTSQVRLYETTGVIECVYGNMNRNSHTGEGAGNAENLGIGFSTAAANNFLVSIVSATNTSSVTNPFTQQLYPVSTPIANLNSPVEGSRRIYSMTPPVPADPAALSFTAVTPIGMTLNWVDNSSNETGFAIYRSTDGVNYTFITKTAANAISSVQGGLSPSTTYFWRVVAVSEGGMSNILAGSQATTAPGIIVSTGAGGLWSSTATWVGGVLPSAFDNVTIVNGATVTIDVTTAVCLNLTVGQGTSGILNYLSTIASTLTVGANVTIAVGGTFQSATTGTVTTHLLSLAGNLTNNGILDFSTNANTAAATITFTGATNNTFGGSGATTDIRTMTINKGTSNANILELNPTNFSVQGTTTDGAPMAFLTLTNGTLKVSGTFTLTGRVFTPAAYTISATAGLWLNNPNFAVAGQNGSPTTSGLLRITSGTYNIGTGSGNSMGFGSGSTIIVEGGAVNATGRFGVNSATNAITYTQSGSPVITVCTVGNASSTLGSFDLGTSLTSVISMTGGTIILQLASTGATQIDYRNQAGSGIAGISGGTLQCGNASSGAAKTYTLRGVLPNLVVNNASAGHTAVMSTTLFNYNNISLNITINATTTFNAGNTVFLFNGTTLTNNGTLTHTGASSNFVWFLTTSPLLYTGAGTVTAPMTNFSIQADMGLTIDPASPNIAVGAIRLYTGSLINSNKITIGNGAATTGIVQIGNTTTPTNAGTFDVPFTFNLGTGGESLLYYRTTTVSRTMGPEIVPSRILSSLTVDDDDATHLLVLAGGNLTISAGTAPTFTFTTGRINLSGSTLTLGLDASTAALAGVMTTGATSHMYNGSYKRWISATTGNRDFPVGVASFKRNASINFTVAPATGGTLTAQWISSPGGSNGLPLVEGALLVTKTANDGYWRVAGGDGLSGGNYTGTFNATGVSGISDVTQLVLLKRVDPSSPWVQDGTHVTGSGTPSDPVLSRTGMAGFSDFGIGSTSLNPLPISLLNFSGYKDGSRNQLRWTTSSEQDNSGFEVQRSTDGINYTVLGFVNSQATGGNSSIQLNYVFADNNIIGSRQYYRLRQVDFAGNSKFSNIVLIKGNKPLTLMIDGLFPNPASNIVNVLIATPGKDKVTMIVTDIAGRTVIQQQLNVETGSSTIPLDISRLTNGTYMVKLVCSSNCEMAVGKFVKQ
ncbi:MAG TPA: T9SS type A sorting domain-containing protein [Chitinophagaceae bacterium]|nr:T9SS type A sorting domain-containing protein [Chitinophagaceae bacterium]